MELVHKAMGVETGLSKGTMFDTVDGEATAGKVVRGDKMHDPDLEGQLMQV